MVTRRANIRTGDSCIVSDGMLQEDFGGDVLLLCEEGGVFRLNR